MKSYHYIVILICCSLLCTGCATQARRSPDLDSLYSRSANYPRPQINPVIIIPGILGSKLKDLETGTVAWGAFNGSYANPSTERGARLIALPMKENVPLRGLKDSIVSYGALDRVDVNVFTLPIRLNAYYNILKILGVGGYRDEDLAKSGTIKYDKGHFTSFQFDYDWRRDIVENAQLLNKFIEEHKTYIQQEYNRRFGIDNYDIKFDIVAHSMGGLIARYYLRYGPADLPDDGSLPDITWKGAENINKLVMVGVPNAGSVKSFINLVEGFKGRSFIPPYSAAVLGTMPSFYQLLPQTRHRAVVNIDNPDGAALDIYDSQLWVDMKWGLASPAQSRILKMLLPDTEDPEQRLGIAVDHQRKCLLRAKRLWESLNTPGDPPEWVTLHLFAGDAVLTDAVVGVNIEDGALSVLEKAPGDGSILRSSALLDERVGGKWEPKLVSPIKWSSVMFLFSDHAGMTKDPAFSDNILYYLLESPD